MVTFHDITVETKLAKITNGEEKIKAVQEEFKDKLNILF